MSQHGKITVIDPSKIENLDLERLMSELPEGYKLQINRQEPIWCDGNCVTQEVDPNEPISMESIRQRWGGRKLILKILDPQGKYIKSKMVSFPDPPRRDGVELVLSPQGTPVRKDELEKKEIEIPAPVPTAPTQNDNMQTALLQTLIQAQATQNQNMQNMLVQRVNHLEQLLEHRTPAQQLGAPHDDGGRPFDGLKDTIKMIKEMEELKAIVGAGRGEHVDSDASPWTGAVEKMLDFVLEREKQNMQMKNAQTMAAHNAPPLPELNRPSPAPAPAASTPSDVQLIEMLQKRLTNADTGTKAQLLQAVLGDELNDVLDMLDDENDEELQDGLNHSCDSDQTELESELISAEDRAELETGETVDQGDSTSTVAQGHTR